MEYILGYAEFNILSLMTYLPLLGALIIMAVVPRNNPGGVQAVATVTTVLTFVLSLVVLGNFAGRHA